MYIIDALKAYGGSELHLLQIARKLDRNKFNPIIFPLRSAKDLIRRFTDFNIPTEECNIKRFYTLAGIKAALRITKIIKKKNVKIIQTFHSDSDIFGTVLGTFLGVPVIISSRRDMGDWSRKKRHIIAYKAIRYFVDKIVVVSNAVGDRIKSLENVHRDKVITIYNGVDLDYFNQSIRKDEVKKNLGLYPNHKVVCMIGNLRPIKGHEYFLQAASSILSDFREVQFMIVGEGPLLEDLEKLTNKLGLHQKVLFLGKTNDIREILSVTDVSVLSSLSEGFSNTILESMSMGKPVVATRVGGNPEAVIDGATGLLVPPRDPNALANAVVKLLKNPELADQFGIMSKGRVREYFSLDGMIANMQGLYESLLDKKGVLRDV
ncbi:MAG: glycosyltransferase [Candidatus Hodarchaeota archaeon]